MAILHDDEEDDDAGTNHHLTVLFPDSDEESAETETEELKSIAVPDEDDDDSTTSGPPDQQVDEHFMSSIQSAVVTRQLRSEGLSFQLWPAATALVELLDRHRSDPASSPLASTLAAFTPDSAARRRLRILELGSGTGFVGIAAAVALSADVTVTDLPHVLENLRINAELNSDVLAKHGGAVNVAALSWGEAEDMEAIGGGEYDLILGSDVVYHDHLYEPLLQTLSFFLLQKKKKVVFVMGHLRRWKKESVFFNKAKKMFDVEVLHRGDQVGGSRHGVAVYRFAAKEEKKLNGSGDRKTTLTT